jgi:D-3-phosphoglycerate dehydrogenase / 2-oxoglutarate reductase
MKIKLLTRSSDLNEILLTKLNQMRLTGETIDYKKSILSQIEDAEVIVNGFGNIDKSLIDGCPNLELIQQTGIGIDNVDVSYCTSKSILVANVPLANAISVAEHTLFLLLYLAKNVREKTLATDNNNNNNNNDRSSLLFERRVLGVLGSEIQRKVLVVIGLGATGLEVAKRAKSFGMHVIAVTKNPFLKKSGIDKAYFVDNLGGSEILSESISRADYVSLHTPLTEETKNMIGAKELALMKKSANLVNVARAPIVDREALYTVLSDRKISGAAFDVFWEEPPNPDDKLLKLNNFILTPHIAGWTADSVDAIARIIATNIERFAQGDIPLTIVNPELTY